MTAWRLKDGVEIYDFPVSPNQHGTLVPARGIQWHPSREGYSGIREGRLPFPTTFSGVLRTEAQYDAMLLWLAKRKKVTLITDLGQEFTVRLTDFKPAQEGSSRQAPAWRWTYTMDLLIFESRLDAAVAPGAAQLTASAPVGTVTT